MMRCAEVLRLLDDLVDGTLTPERARAMAAHLEACAACRRVETKTRALLAGVAQLPDAIPPARDLWPGIAARLGASVVSFASAEVASWRGRWLPLAAAAVVLVAATAVVTVRLMSPSRRGDATSRASGAVPAHLTGEPGLTAAISDYQRAAGALRAALAERRPMIAPDALRVVEENLDVVDAAIGQLSQALAADPSNRNLALLLASTYERQIELLETANTLSRT